MTQYEVELSREDAGQEPMTLTLSRPLAPNRILIVSSNKALSIPIDHRDNEGRLIKKDIPDNELNFTQRFEPIFAAFLDHQTNRIDVQSYRTV